MADDRTIASIFPTHHTRDYVIKRNSQGERESPPYHSLSYLSKKSDDRTSVINISTRHFRIYVIKEKDPAGKSVIDR
jgi:hypothetical protein